MALRSTFAVRVPSLAVALVVFALPVRLVGVGGEAAGDQEDLRNAFLELQKQTPVESADPPPTAGPPKTFVHIKPVPTKYGDAKNIIKVWGELEETGEKVSLAHYHWKPEQGFYLVFETAVPVQFGLHYLTGNGTISTQVLPDEGIAESKKVIPARRIYKLPVALETEKDSENELIAITVVAIGQDRGPVTFSRTEMDKMYQDNRSNNRTFKGIDEAPDKVISNNEDDVARIVVSTHSRATIDVELHKAK